MTATKRAALKVADQADPIGLVLLAAYAVAREFWPGLELSQDTLLTVAAAIVALRGWWERRKRSGMPSPAEFKAAADAVLDAIEDGPDGRGDV